MKKNNTNQLEKFRVTKRKETFGFLFLFLRNERGFKRMLKNLRAFQIKFIPVSNSRGARISIKDLRFNKNKFIPYDYEKGNIKEMADNYLKTLGINCFYGAELSESAYIILTDNFNIMLK